VIEKAGRAGEFKPINMKLKHRDYPDPGPEDLVMAVIYFIIAATALSFFLAGWWLAG